MTDQTDKPKLGTRPPLGIKRTVETGKVKQSFSHGRSNTVVVEVKKRRILGKPADAEAPKTPTPKPRRPSRKPRPSRPLRRARAEAFADRRHYRRKEMPRKSCFAKPRKRACFARGSAPPRRPARRRTDRGRARRAERTAAPKRPPPKRPRGKPRRRAPVEQARADREAEPLPPLPPPVDQEEERPAPPRPRARSQAPRAGAPVARPRRAAPARQADRHPRAVGRGRQPRPLAGGAPPRPRKGKARPPGGRPAGQKQVRDVVVPEAITVQELANRMAERGADLVKALFKMGMPVTLTQTIDQDTAELLVTEFGHNIKRVSEADVEIGIGGEEDAPETLKPRRRSSPSWAMSTTARRRCSTRSAAPTSCPARPAASPSISAPIR
jgi:translation initiation factor IF-2